MNSLVAVIVGASLAFVGTMFDNYFAFATQLLVTDKEHYRRVAIAQAIGVGCLLIVAVGVSSLLHFVPLRVVGLFCVAPWALAWYAFQHRHDERRQQYKRGALTTFVVTIALGGDNLAVWIPLVRANSTLRGLATVVVFAVWEVLFIVSAQAAAGHPRVVAWGTKTGPLLVPWVYVGLGFLILIECHTFT